MGIGAVLRFEHRESMARRRRSPLLYGPFTMYEKALLR